jgi:hypothetical protein
MIKTYLTFAFIFLFDFCYAQTIYVSTSGDDINIGTLTRPVKSVSKAISLALNQKNKDVVIEFSAGVYPILKTIKISSGDYKLKSLTIKSKKDAKVTFTGSETYKLAWKTYRDNVFSASLVLTEKPDQLFLNGELMRMARYPNYDPKARVYNGTAADAIADDKVKKWANPAGGYIHALHAGEWGDFHYKITGKNSEGKLIYEGGWQNNRPSKMHPQHRFVENIFEELDAPGEWFYDQKNKTIYLFPQAGVNLNTAKITLSKATDLIHIVGSTKNPVKNITISGIEFTQTARSFMLTNEPLLRSDWTIYRGGAILLDGTENINIKNSNFYNLGGNAIFLSNYNKNNTITGNHIYNIGATAIAFVGDPNSVRSPAFKYEAFVPWDKMDYTKGPKSNNFPQQCYAVDNLINNIGTIEKQATGVEISMSAKLTIGHNTIYHTPRAGINISEGTFGGHIIEFNDVFETVLETGDHGAFNSWGRDRFWRPNRNIIDSVVAAKPGIELLDIIAPNILRNNRFQCDHGWDIDLDDGSSSYEIYNNVCLSGGLKLREGYHRSVKNNIILNNTFHPHVWLKNSSDVFKNNIVSYEYAPIQIDDWGQNINNNFFLTQDALVKTQKLGTDSKSMAGYPLFKNAQIGDFRVQANSPALKVGFKNFDMDFGVLSKRLKAIAKTPKIPLLLVSVAGETVQQTNWLGASVKNIDNLGERSAAGLPNNNGALIIQINESSQASKTALQKGDVIIGLDHEEIKSINDLIKVYSATRWKGYVEIVIMRNQSEQKFQISLKE